MHKLLIALALPALFVTLAFQPSTRDKTDREAVERAVLDYVEAIYDVKPELIERSVSKDLKKYGFWRKDAQSEYAGSAMTYAQLHELAGKYNAQKQIPADAPKKVVILDVLDKTASAKLTAQWGIDLMQLAKIDGKWQILHVLWQSHPPTGAR